MVEEVKELCYHDDLLYSEDGVQRAVSKNFSAARYKLRDVSSLLINKSLPLKNGVRLYDECVRWVWLFGSEGWPVTEKDCEYPEKLCRKDTERYGRFNREGQSQE